MKLLLTVVSILLLLLSFVLFCSTLSFEQKLRRSILELNTLAEFHKDYVDQHVDTTWEQYIVELEQYNKKLINSNKTNTRFQLYLDHCKNIKD